MTALFVLATFARLVWTNPDESFDAIRARQINSPGDTVARTIYANAAAPLVVKLPGTPGAADTAFISVSAANIVRGVTRLIVETRNSAGWSQPSSPASGLWGARDTTYYVMPGMRSPQRGPALLTFSQALGDTSFVWFESQEQIQAENKARLCEIFGYACRRGVRDTAWCVTP